METVKKEIKKEVKADDVTIRGWVQRDIESAISVLNMIRNDPEMMRAIQDIVITRIRIQEENEANGPDMFNQTPE